MTQEQRKTKEAAKLLFKNIESISHLLPRAYCVAKPSAFCGVFAVPTVDNEPQVKDRKWLQVNNDSCFPVNAGDWASLAYIMTKDGTGDNYVVRKL